jgi:uncharacterized membrane protein
MWSFLKKALFGGLGILLPILLLIIVLKEFVELMIGLATPIADLLPKKLIESVPETEVLAVLLIVVTSLVIGLLSMIPVVRAAGESFERRVLSKVPVYLPLKSLLQALLGSEEAEKFQPAFIKNDDGSLEPCYIVEDIGRPRLFVLVPWTPASFAGSLKLIPRERVHPIDLTFDEFSLAIGHFGVGLADSLPEEMPGSKAQPKETTGQQEPTLAG